MVALALDIGETRIGIAVSSRDGKMAMPVKVLPAAEVTGMAKTFRYHVAFNPADQKLFYGFFDFFKDKSQYFTTFRLCYFFFQTISLG